MFFVFFPILLELLGGQTAEWHFYRSTPFSFLCLLLPFHMSWFLKMSQLWHSSARLDLTADIVGCYLFTLQKYRKEMVLMLKCVIRCVLDCWIFVTLVFHFDIGPLFVLFMFEFRQKQRQNYEGWKYEGMIKNLNVWMKKLSLFFSGRWYT